ncbi:MAG: hypothetical protein LBD11_05170 [Candidatus Peribacteria bacterium]|nr:hypothetical protein [Candidatus Peribacteria bacterium]
MQAGGAVFIVALTSASSGLITPEVAFPIILGSYIGATITIVMASIGRQPTIKKQVAVGHVGFNTLTALIGMFGMPFILRLFSTYIFPKVGVVMGLSIFYIAMRSFVAILVFPFLDFFTRLIQK